MKTCKTCKKDKPVSDFARAKANKDGLNGSCRTCVKAKWTDWYENRGGKEANRERNKTYYRTDKGKAGNQRKKLAKYGLTLAQFEEMKNNSPLCPLCQKREATHIDHDHDTGVVRGLLCDPCNKALGLFLEDSETLIRAAEYVSRSIPPT